MGDEPEHPFARRRAGVLLHPTSLPGAGALGAAARAFIELIANAGFSVWQTLPLGPVGGDGSPYQTHSVFAGHTGLLAWDEPEVGAWVEHGGGAGRGLGGGLGDRLHAAALGFAAIADEPARADHARFVGEAADWLEDYARFAVYKGHFAERPWWEWPQAVRDRDPAALAALDEQLSDALEAERFGQFLFHRQWQAIRAHAHAHGVLLFGDMPIFVALDSMEVWSNPDAFALDADKRPLAVAGVPPDYFSETGQRWGNPLYDWRAMAADNFAWWVRRLGVALSQFDLVRIDHFRGFQAYWEIPAENDTAAGGQWVEAPGEALFTRLCEAFGERLPVVAEDLGVITPEVEALRDRFRLPGMKILQFAFDGYSDNPYLPHSHVPLAVVYTGTHDNDTTLGWYQSLEASERQRVLDYHGYPQEAMPRPLLRSALASVAKLAMIPFQDLLGLDGSARMNRPGTVEGNWAWAFQWSDLPEHFAADYRHLLEIYGRLVR